MCTSISEYPENARAHDPAHQYADRLGVQRFILSLGVVRLLIFSPAVRETNDQVLKALPLA
jgi:hypothetical protein